MNIGLVTYKFDVGGLEHVVYSIYKQFKNTGINVTIFIEEDSNGWYQKKCDPKDIVLLNGSENVFFTEIASRSIELLNFHHSTFYLKKARVIGIPIAYTIHNCYTWLSDIDFCEWSRIVEYSNALISVSSYVKNYYDQRSGSLHNNSRVILNGINQDMIKSSSIFSKIDFGISEDTYVFAQFASFYPIKHQYILINVAKKLKNEFGNFKILLFGNVGDTDYYEFIKNYINTENLNDVVEIMGNVQNNVVPGILKGVVDCALSTTMQEGNSISVLEALATNTPLIMTETGNFMDLKGHGWEVCFVPATLNVHTISSELINKTSKAHDSNNFDAIFNAMRNKLISRKQKDAMGLSPKNTFPYTIENTCNAYFTVFSDLVSI